jgi:valyl-tRNA synthetase
MPYITEHLYQRLPHRKGEAHKSISIAPFPETLVSFEKENVEDAINDLQQTMVKFRSLFASLNVAGNAKTLDLQIKVSDAGLKNVFDSEKEVIQSLVKSKTVSIVDGNASDPSGAIKNYIDQKVSIYILNAQELVG